MEEEDEEQVEEEEEQPRSAASQSLAEVTESRKPIKKMINIHVGDAVAASMCRWDGPAIVSARSLSHTHIYNESDEKCSPVCCNCCVLGGADQEVNMIQSSSFISLMTALAANGDRGRPARLKVAAYCWPA